MSIIAIFYLCGSTIFLIRGVVRRDYLSMSGSACFMLGSLLKLFM